jgi:hypothetical protein
LKPSHLGAHEWSRVEASLPEEAEVPVGPTSELQCDACKVKRTYRTSGLRVTLYDHGVCTVSFFCLSCRELTEFEVPDKVAVALDKAGVPTTIVHVPGEVLEWPAKDVLPIQEFDAEVLERSSLSHVSECFRRELLYGSIDFGG